MPGGRWSGLLRFGLPGLLLGLALASGGRGGGRELWAQVSIPAPVPVSLPGPAGHASDRSRPGVTHGGAADGTIAFTTNSYGPVQFLYLIDTQSRAFVIYRVDSTNPKGTVKLEAARQYGWDLKLTEYNNSVPEVTAVEAMVKTTESRLKASAQPTNR